MKFTKNLLLSLFGFAILTSAFSQSKMLTGQLAPMPPMGFNTWNTFQTKISEDMLKEMVDVYVELRNERIRLSVFCSGRWMDVHGT